MKLLKNYALGALWGAFAGLLWLLWVYRKAEQFPGNPTLNRYYAWLRRLDEA